MGTSMSSAGRPAYYSIRRAAWLLSVEQCQISRAIRIGSLRAVRRRSQLVVPACEVARLLGSGVSGHDAT